MAKKPLNYGVPSGTKTMGGGGSGMVSQAKEWQAGSPKPKANQSEGRPGRQSLGSGDIKIKEGAFNEHRAKAT